MQEFMIHLGSVQDVQDFVAMATSRPYLISVRDDHNKIMGSSFMEMFCLDFAKPLRVVAECSDAELEDLLRAADRCLVS